MVAAPAAQPPSKVAAGESSAAKFSATTLESLPYDLIIEHILTALPTASRCRAARVNAHFHLLCQDRGVWADIELQASTTAEALKRGIIGRHTTSLAVRNARGAYRHRFCRFHLMPPAMRPHESACGGLTDAGASALLGACHNLKELQLPGMAHLSQSTLVSILGCPSLRTVNLRGCELICSGFALAQEARTSALPRRPQLRCLDLSHTRAEDEDLVALLEVLPGLRQLQFNFCAALTDDALDALPRTIESVEALGCERFSWWRMERLRQVCRVHCDDSAVLSIGSAQDGSDVAQSLLAMLASYRAEEARRE